jgi:alkanesulfonate monooxygenase SsuD/methylene tetrahydromethanopterin reductase-like flavin-dependent oxidoreductase (luciferase family)
VALKFGVFDHVDYGGAGSVTQLFDDRLKLVEQYDRGGFHAYHVAEHHSTPLGMAPSPSVFLAAVAQRTSRLRFGPLVFVTPMYHPLRAIEEIVMLDHLSHGRLELGLGRGASPIEIGSFGVDFDTTPDRNREATEIILKGLTTDLLSHRGRFYQFDKVRIAARPVQQPYPPLWFALVEAERAKWAARSGANMVTLVPNPAVRAITDAYRSEWEALGKSEAAMPFLGVTRHIVVADSDEKAREIARPAYRSWRGNMAFLWDWASVPFPLDAILPAEFDQLEQSGSAIAGTPDKVRSFIDALVRQTGVTYVVGDFIFGSMPFAAASRSVELFAKDVLPSFR